MRKVGFVLIRPNITEIMGKIILDPELTHEQKEAFINETLRKVMNNEGVRFDSPEDFLDYFKNLKINNL